jgi:uncharacterized membrane protein YdjX (TVP38/TMEM64 family)
MLKALRILTILLLAALAVSVAAWILGTEQGRALLHDPHKFARPARDFVFHHPLSAPLLYLLAYCLLCLALMPVWWLQILAGYAFGLYWGCAYSLVSAAIAAVLILSTSRLMGTGELRKKAEGKLQRLSDVMDKVGHNGLLTVMAVRLVHVIPFALSNHVFALTPIRAREVFLGTFAGALPGIAFYVALGADRHLLTNGLFWLALASINVVLLIPLALRYLAPDWFKRLGLE